MSEEVLIEKKQGVMVITMNRPDAKNAMNKATAEQIGAALDELDQSDELRVAILTGAGGTFCSGMDLKGFLKGEMPIAPGKGFGGVTEKPPTKPLIAAVEGYALAGGFELAMACDLIVASEEARFGIPEVKRGLIAGAGGLIRLPRQIPYHIAMEYALTGDHFEAERGWQLGLINRLCPAGNALEEALKLAQAIAENGPLAVVASKEIVQQSADWSQDEMWQKQSPFIAKIFTSKDSREGAKAFAEKRKPEWTGK